MIHYEHVLTWAHTRVVLEFQTRLQMQRSCAASRCAKKRYLVLVVRFSKIFGFAIQNPRSPARRS